MEYAGDLLTHVHLAGSFDHTASSGLRYIVNPPGSTARVHQHVDIGQGEVNWDDFFATLSRIGFDGRATCRHLMSALVVTTGTAAAAGRPADDRCR
jgi:myo-inositol catabolism protein IolH